MRTPTLVIHRADDRAAPLQEAVALADGIPGAQLVVVPGRSHLPYMGDAQSAQAKPFRRARVHSPFLPVNPQIAGTARA